MCANKFKVESETQSANAVERLGRLKVGGVVWLD